jgi:ribosomal protein S18 acetylase RimI-like enzyme
MRRQVEQLSSSARAPTEDELQELVDSPATRLLVARDEDGNIVGSLTLALFRIPTGCAPGSRMWSSTRRRAARGWGETLTMEALRLAHGAGARTVDLTVRPEREAAERLYRRLGFKRRDTSVYRGEFSDRA